eukprot:3454927-Rhodomonas_salina.4
MPTPVSSCSRSGREGMRVGKHRQTPKPLEAVQSSCKAVAKESDGLDVSSEARSRSRAIYATLLTGNISGAQGSCAGRSWETEGGTPIFQGGSTA